MALYARLYIQPPTQAGGLLLAGHTKSRNKVPNYKQVIRVCSTVVTPAQQPQPCWVRSRGCYSTCRILYSRTVGVPKPRSSGVRTALGQVVYCTRRKDYNKFVGCMPGGNKILKTP